MGFEHSFLTQSGSAQVIGWIWLYSRPAIFWGLVRQQEEAVVLMLLHLAELTGKCTIAIGVYCSRAVWRQGYACWWGTLNLRLEWQNIFSRPCIFRVINHIFQIKIIFLLAYLPQKTAVQIWWPNVSSLNFHYFLISLIVSDKNVRFHINRNFLFLEI